MSNFDGKRVAIERKKKGYTQDTFADKLGTNRSMISKWERGICDPPDDIQAKITMILNPVPKKEEPKKFPEHKNHEGYVDMTAYKAINNIKKPNINPLPGEIWRHQRNADGRVFNKLILKRDGNDVICVTVFSKNGPLYRPLQIQTNNKQERYVDFKFIECLRLDSGFDGRVCFVSDRTLNNVLKQIVHNVLGVEPEKEIVEKEVVKEVEVIKEVPVEPAHDFEFEEAKIGYRIYKDCFERLTDALGGKLHG